MRHERRHGPCTNLAEWVVRPTCTHDNVQPKVLEVCSAHLVDVLHQGAACTGNQVTAI